MFIAGTLFARRFTPQLPSLLEFAVSLRPDLGGLAIHEVQRRNVADRAVQANPVVIFEVLPQSSVGGCRVTCACARV